MEFFFNLFIAETNYFVALAGNYKQNFDFLGFDGIVKKLPFY